MKKILSLVTTIVMVTVLICSAVSVHADDADFILSLSADKTYSLAVGDVINVTVTPEKITHTEGICSYDAKGITFDADVLSLDSENLQVAHSDFKAYASQPEKGKITIMVIDYSTDGRQLHDGEGALTLKFTVIAEAEKTTISMAGATINGTVANAALDSCPGAAGKDLTLSFGDTPITEPDISDNNSVADETESKNSAENSSDVTSEQKNSSALVWIVIIIIIVGCVTGSVIFLSKKKNGE